MTQDEKDLLKMYFVNQGLRYDLDLDSARVQCFAHPTERSLYALAIALGRKASFNKVMYDVCALLDI